MQTRIFKKLSIPVTIALAIVLYALNQKHKKQVPIDFALIDSITIEPNYNTNPRFPPPQKLSTELTKKFIDDWNNAAVKGIYNYNWVYIMKVYYKNDSIKSLWANGGMAQEESSETFEMNKKDYFDELWKNSLKR